MAPEIRCDEAVKYSILALKIRMVAAASAILEQHIPTWDSARQLFYCPECSDAEIFDWPCGTVRTIADKLGVEL